MIESFLNRFRKRPRLDSDETTTITTQSFENDLLWRLFLLGSNENNDHPHLSTENRPINLNERFVTILDRIDASVEIFRKEALNLQEKKDFLYMSMDLLKNNDQLHNLNEAELEELMCYMQRVNSRLSTVDLHVRTVRDRSQEDSLSHVNILIDGMIKIGDPVMSRKRCQQYLNCCCGTKDDYEVIGVLGQDNTDIASFDKTFECALLGCTLDDQKVIKKRLHALMVYLNKQTIRP